MLGIITLIEAFFMLKKKKDKNLLPSFKNLVETKHHVKGRLRLKINLLIDNKEAIDYLTGNLKKIEPIKKIEVNPMIGSVLINYDEDQIDPIIIISACLKILDLEKELEKTPAGFIDKELNNINNSLDRTIYEKSNGLVNLKSVIKILLIGTGVYRVIKYPKMLPGGITLLWWAYQSIRGDE